MRWLGDGWSLAVSQLSTRSYVLTSVLSTTNNRSKRVLGQDSPDTTTAGDALST